MRFTEPWFAPIALVNGAALGIGAGLTAIGMAILTVTMLRRKGQPSAPGGAGS